LHAHVLRLVARAQGTLGKWKKAVGDKVVPGDILAEIQTARAPNTTRAHLVIRSRCASVC
jgi:hypothetical protein